MNLIFLDLETTGVTKDDRIVEISIVKPMGETAFYTNYDKRTKRINPTIPIPKGASDVHGITDEMVKDCPTFKQIANSILEFMTGCDIVTYNGNSFDLPLLYNEFARAGITWDYKKHNLIDACNIFKIKESRTLTAAVKFYLDREHEDAHGAESDTLATAEVFFAQLEKYGLTDKTPAELALFSNYDKQMLDLSGSFTLDAEGDICFNFGVHKGKKAKTEKSYLNWMINKGNFNKDTVDIAHHCTFL